MKKEDDSTECDVCGTEILEKKFSTTTDYKEKKYQFCGEDCKKEFEENPEKYTKKI